MGCRLVTPHDVLYLFTTHVMGDLYALFRCWGYTSKDYVERVSDSLRLPCCAPSMINRTCKRPVASFDPMCFTSHPQADVDANVVTGTMLLPPTPFTSASSTMYLAAPRSTVDQRAEWIRPPSSRSSALASRS